MHQLAHVARPVVHHEALEGIAGEPGQRPPVLRREAHQEGGRQGRDVAAPQAQRRQVDPEDVEAIEEVLAEAARRHLLPQVVVGRRDQPDVDGHRLVASDAFELTGLEEAQQLDLERRRGQPDLVEVESPARGLHEPPLAAGDRAGEGAPLVAKELRLEQRIGERRAAQLDERALGAPAHPVDGLGQEVLAGAAVAGQEDGAPALGHLLRTVEGGPHRRVIADDAERGHDAGAARGFGLGLLEEPGPLHRATQRVEERLDVDRLLDEVVGAALHRVDRGVDRRIGGHHHDPGRGGGGAHVVEEGQAVEARHPEIGEHDRRLHGADQLESAEGVLRGDDLVALSTQQPGQRRAGPRLVVDDQDAPERRSFRGSCRRGVSVFHGSAGRGATGAPAAPTRFSCREADGSTCHDNSKH